ncbi:MAG: hypothetical protein RLZZ09_3504, partial [Pseudomonadota bacterium]
YVWVIAGHYRPVRYWASGSLLGAAGALFIGLRETLPASFSILSGNILLIFGWLIVDGGVMLAAGRTPPWRWGAAFALVGLAGVTFHTLVQPDLAVRCAWGVLPTLLFDGSAALACLMTGPGSRQTALRLLGGLTLTIMLSNMVRVGFVLQNDTQNLFANDWPIIQYYLFSIVMMMLGSMLSVLLANLDIREHLDRELEERKQSEAALRASEAQFRLLTDTSELAISVWQTDSGECHYLNQTFTRLLGYTRDDLANLADWWRRAYPDNDQRRRVMAEWNWQLQRARISGCPPEPLETCIVCKDDTSRIIRWMFHGHNGLLYGFGLDLTELRRAERQIRAFNAELRQAVDQRTEELRISAERLHLALEGAKLGTWHWDIRQDRLEWSERLYALFDIPEGTVMNYERFLAAIHPDDREVVDAATQVSLEQGKDWEMEYRSVRRHGGAHWLFGRGRTITGADGRPDSMEGVVMDIHCRKENELALREINQRLIKLASRVPGVIYQYRQRPDGTSCFPFASEGMRDIYRVAPERVREDASPVFAILHPDDFDRIVDTIQASARDLTTWQVEYRVRFEDGSERWLFGNSTPEREPDGGTLWHGYIYDITERKRAEQAIYDLNANLERMVEERTNELVTANAAKSQFLAHMSHEIRTPMNAVLGLARLLTQEPLSETQAAMVKHIGEAGDALLRIINDILDLSKIEAGQIQIASEPFQPASILDHIRNMLGPAATQKGIGLEVEDDDLDDWVLGDALRLEQVLINLVSNAIKFTQHGSVRVSGRSVRRADDGNRARFEIHDTGIGIDAEGLARLFKPFSQGDSSITRRFGGTGLGLSISKHLVELMGGELGADSQPGEGSTFWLELTWPRAQKPAPSGTVISTASDNGPGLKGLRVLVVDDNRINQMVARKALERAGATVETADDGQQALDRLRAVPDDLDVVLMDIQMPVMDGLAATRAIREDPALRHLSVIALSAGVLPEEREAASAAGVDDFLAKPLDFGTLVSTVLRARGGN